MSFDFQETFLLEIPNVDAQLAEFAEHDFQESHGLVVEIAAIHSGLTSNYNAYDAGALEASLASWTQPYPKPIILNHDVMTEPVGRVIGARMDKEADGTSYVRLQAAITDPLAVAKVSDQRYLTGSVGGKANEARCSICDTDWAAPKESARGLPCRHMRGKVYGGKLAFLNMKQVAFKEYSFVNVPADERSGVVPSAVAEEGEGTGWVKAARFLVVDMDHEEIVEYTESESHELLSGMKKKEAAPFYHGMKGAYLAVLAIEEADKPKPYGNVKYADPKNNKYPIDTEAHVRAAWSYINMPKNASKYSPEELKAIKARIKAAMNKFGIKTSESSTNSTDDNDLHEETVMADKSPAAEVEDDILAVTEGLSEDLEKISDVSEDEDEDAEGTVGSAGVPDEDEEKKEEAPAADEEKPAEEPTTSDETAADEKPAEEKPADEEAPAEDNADAKTEEEGERPEAQEKPQDKDVDPETSAGAPVSREDAAIEDEGAEQTDDAELTEADASAEPLVEELKSELESLKLENAKLRKALHHTLAERVVDAKIGAGLVDFETRKEAIEEHATRTASSLADSLRDYAGQIVKVGVFGAPKLTMAEESEVVGDGEQVITIGEDEESSDSKPDPMRVAEDTLVDALVGRISLQF